MYERQKGNALFLILIGVALFAALSYAVTQSGRGGNNAKKEEAAIAAAQITQYASQIEQVIMRMKIVSGCSAEEISFHYDSDGDGTLETDGSDEYYNSNAPGTNVCSVFHPQGGKVAYTPPNSNWLDGVNTSAFKYGELFFSGSSCFPGLGSDVSGCYNDSNTGNEDLVLFIPYLREDICQELAKKLDVTQPDGSIPVEYVNAWVDTPFTGTFADGAQLINNLGDDTSQSLKGKMSACFEGGNTGNPPPGTYHFYHVLILR